MQTTLVIVRIKWQLRRRVVVMAIHLLVSQMRRVAFNPVNKPTPTHKVNIADSRKPVNHRQYSYLNHSRAARYAARSHSLWHAPLWVCSASSGQQPPESSVLNQVDCFSPGQSVRVQVILNRIILCISNIRSPYDLFQRRWFHRNGTKAYRLQNDLYCVEWDVKP